jgi:hypothetical protein
VVTRSSTSRHTACDSTATPTASRTRRTSRTPRGAGRQHDAAHVEDGTGHAGSVEAFLAHARDRPRTARHTRRQPLGRARRGRGARLARCATPTPRAPAWEAVPRGGPL